MFQHLLRRGSVLGILAHESLDHTEERCSDSRNEFMPSIPQILISVPTCKDWIWHDAIARMEQPCYALWLHYGLVCNIVVFAGERHTVLLDWHEQSKCECWAGVLACWYKWVEGLRLSSWQDPWIFWDVSPGLFFCSNNSSCHPGGFAKWCYFWRIVPQAWACRFGNEFLCTARFHSSRALMSY